MGADEVIDYKTEDVVQRVKDLTDGQVRTLGSYATRCRLLTIHCV